MPDKKYAVWSNEHRAFWRGARGGYTPSRVEAGVYSRDEALSICINAIPGTAKQLGVLPEIPVCFDDLEEIARQHRRRFPNVPIEPWE